MTEPELVTRVCIATPPLTVTCEAPGVDLAEVRAHALDLYRELWRDDMRGTHTGGVGFSAERSRK